MRARHAHLLCPALPAQSGQHESRGVLASEPGRHVTLTTHTEPAGRQHVMSSTPVSDAGTAVKLCAAANLQAQRFLLLTERSWVSGRLRPHLAAWDPASQGVARAQVFRGEAFVDKHMDHKHGGERDDLATSCLAAHCNALSCAYFQAFKAHSESLLRHTPCHQATTQTHKRACQVRCVSPAYVWTSEVYVRTREVYVRTSRVHVRTSQGSPIQTVLVGDPFVL